MPWPTCGRGGDGNTLYALDPKGPFAPATYEMFLLMLNGQLALATVLNKTNLFRNIHLNYLWVVLKIAILQIWWGE